MLRASRPSFAALCGLALLASACASDHADEVPLYTCDPVPKGHPDRDMLEAIDEMGLCGSSAVDMGDSYLVEGDIRVAKSTLTDKQARTSTLVSTANIRAVTVRVADNIPNNGGVDDWRGAVQGAIAVWNAVPYNLVRLEYVTSGTPDIMFRSDLGGLPDQQAADATFPSNGEPGGDVAVNLDFDGDAPLTDGQKLFLAVHEIGHCIGLRHTNWSPLGESGAVHISGTPSSDSASVMNGGTAGFEFAGLSSYDALAIRLIYPEVVTMNVEFTGCSNGTPRMAATWGGTLVQPTIEWQLERNTNGAWSQVYRGTGHTWTFSVPTGTSLKLRVRGRSAEGWSLYRSITRTAPGCNTLPQ
ncbi:MAG: hypothetical protein K8M05_27220 [Deltaproteobacteria bacterium]|nr:hypothetical protein [Kofleriaceae bacterium]